MNTKDEQSLLPSRTVQITIYGRPQQRGSKKAVLIPKRGGGWVTNATGRPITAAKDDNPKSKDWMASVRQVAAEVFSGELLRGPIRLTVAFYFSRPKCHFRTGRNAHLLREQAPRYHASTPDLAKLVRCLEDALTGVVWADDRQVCWYDDCRKMWTTEQERAEVSIREM